MQATEKESGCVHEQSAEFRVFEPPQIILDHPTPGQVFQCRSSPLVTLLFTFSSSYELDGEFSRHGAGVTGAVAVLNGNRVGPVSEEVIVLVGLQSGEHSIRVAFVDFHGVEIKASSSPDINFFVEISEEGKAADGECLSVWSHHSKHASSKALFEKARQRLGRLEEPAIAGTRNGVSFQPESFQDCRVIDPFQPEISGPVEVVQIHSPASFKFAYLPSINHDVALAIKGLGVWQPVQSLLFHTVIRGAGSLGLEYDEPLVVDIGANVGWFSLLARALNCRVVSWEPQLWSFDGISKPLRSSFLRLF